MPKHKNSLFIFRRDLRYADNTGLLAACAESERVLPIFIFDPRQISEHAYRSDNGLRFMLASLSDLDQQLADQGAKLHCFWGDPIEVVEAILKEIEVSAIYINQDYTPFALERDKQIAELAQRKQIEFKASDDSLLNPPNAVLKSDGKPYVVYTAYFKAASKLGSIKPPSYVRASNLILESINSEIKLSDPRLSIEPNLDLNPRGGRAEALEILKGICRLKDYKEQRDIPSLDITTRLSAHNKFGTVSVREVYTQVAKYLGVDHTLIRELYWRDFFTQIGFHFSHVFSGCFYRQYDQVQWEHSPERFEAWCNGKTGFPIVDAGMRELNKTGFMHNRVRMIVASFLTKDLHISWREGEKYFARKLVDYDPAVNNGNWQWAASTGCDAQPYFRIFNPWLQQKRFDPEAKYIKKWVPELASLTAKQLHDSEATAVRLAAGYIAPIAEHDLERDRAIDLYKVARSLS